MRVYSVLIENYEITYRYVAQKLPVIVNALNTWKERQSIQEGCRLRIEMQDGKRKFKVPAIATPHADDILY